MSTLSKTLTTGAALAACLLFAAPATVAQRDQASERTQEAEARHRRDVEEATRVERAEREAAHRREAEAAAERKRQSQADGTHKDQAANEARRRAAAEHKIDPVEREAHLKKIRGEEERHRKTLARIRRLRQLAQTKGQAERLAALDNLEAKEGRRYEEQVARRKELLGDAMHRKVEEHLRSGRGHDSAGRAKQDALHKRNQAQRGKNNKAKAVHERKLGAGRKTAEREPGRANDGSHRAEGRGQNDGSHRDAGRTSDDGGGRNPRSL